MIDHKNLLLSEAKQESLWLINYKFIFMIVMAIVLPLLTVMVTVVVQLLKMTAEYVVEMALMI